MDIKKQFNRISTLVLKMAQENPTIDFYPLEERIDRLYKDVELKLAELDEEIRYREWEELGMPPF